MSLLQNLLTHLILASIAPDHPARLHWLGEAGAFQFQIRYRITAVLIVQIVLDGVWLRSVSQALLKASEIGAIGPLGERAVSLALDHSACPFSLQDLCVEDFDPHEKADRPAATPR